MNPIEMFQQLPPEQQQELVKQGVKGADKLFSGIKSALGYFFEPKHIKQMAEAEAHRIKVLADAKSYEIDKIGDALRNNKDLPVAFHNDDSSLAIDISDGKQLVERSNFRLQYQQAKKEQNIESVIGKAVLELGDKTTNSTEEVDEDWYTRFFETVEDISDEQVQSLWARILAGEVLKPRTYTYRLLSVLRNISKNELDIILKIAPLVCGDVILNEHTSLKSKGITGQDISILGDMGVLKDGGLQARCIELKSGDVKLFSQTDKFAFVFHNRGKEYINYFIDVFEITETGKKIFELANEKIDMDSIKSAFCILYKDFPDLHIFGTEITKQEEDKIFFSNQQINLK